MKKLISIFFISIMTSIVGCKKESTGGGATLIVYPKHHHLTIKDATVYVSFGATDLPDDPKNNYDLKVKGSSHEEFVRIEDLRYGNYYLFVEAFDSATAETVVGGLGIKILFESRKSEIKITIPVSEE